jgi:tetratricopeptide (TPR) repeat protein
LHHNGRWDEAVAHYEEALRLAPKDANAHLNLGVVLHQQGRKDEAVAHYKEALRLNPKEAKAYYNLGRILLEMSKLDEAMRYFEQAVRLDPKNAQAYAAFGGALLTLGRFADARDATRRCLDLLPKHHSERAPVTRQLQRCERMLALEGHLQAVLEGQEKPASAAERLEFGQLCQMLKRYAAAARLYGDAFAADPKRPHDLRVAHRYNAACCAALAGCGQGKDPPPAEDAARARLRQQALDWLRADLAAWAKATDRALVQRTLQHWQEDSDFAGVREQEELAKLSTSERQAWISFWADVAAQVKLNSPGAVRHPLCSYGSVVV